MQITLGNCAPFPKMEREDALNTVRPLLRRGFLEAPIAMERNGPARRCVGAIALFTVFHIEVLVKQTPPQGDGFPGEVGIHLIRDPIDRDTRVDADLPVLGFAGKRTEAL